MSFGSNMADRWEEQGAFNKPRTLLTSKKEPMKYKITVYDYSDRLNGLNIPVRSEKEIHKWENIDAFCAGGEEGVFAIFFIPDTDTIGIAVGDDGHWKLQQVYHKRWLDAITQTALNAFTAQENGEN